MKMHPRTAATTLCLGLILGAVAYAGGQTVVETTTNATGTISEFNPNTIVIKTESSSAPIRYTSTRTTTYVDENGVPVSIQTVKSGAPATVYYVMEGDRMVASKVVVRKASSPQVAATQTRTAAEALTFTGVISDIRPDTLMVRSDSSVEPLRYRYTRATTYVDESGVPVARESVRSGLPVTVYFRKDGDRLVAYKVMVRRGPVVEPVLEEKKTTTTTTTTGPTEK